MSEESELQRYVDLVRRQWLIIAVVTIATMAVSVGLAILQTSQYRSSAILEAVPATSSATTDQDLETTIETLVRVAGTEAVRQAAADALGVEDAAELASRIAVVREGQSRLIRISGTGPSPAEARELAAAVTEAFLAQRRDQVRAALESEVALLERQIDQLGEPGTEAERAFLATLQQRLISDQAAIEVQAADVAVVEPATTPEDPFAPHPLRNGAFGFMAGLVLGVLIALMRDRLNRRLRDIDEVEAAWRLPVLGAVPTGAGVNGDRRQAIADFGGHSPIAEAYRAIRTNLTLLFPATDPGEGRVIVITSAVAAEWKTSVCANVSTALAQEGRAVLAISADLRAPALVQCFGLRDDGAGLLDALTGNVTIDDIVELGADDDRAVALIADDRRFPDPAMLIGGPRMVELLEDARRNFEITLVDAPPLLPASEAAVLARLADAVIVVSRVGAVTRDDVARARQRLAAVSVEPAGVIATGVAVDPFSGYGYGYGTQD